MGENMLRLDCGRAVVLALAFVFAAPVAAQQYANPVDGTETGTTWDSICGTTTDSCGCIADGANGLGDTTGDGTDVYNTGTEATFACEIDNLTDPSDTTNTFLRYRALRTSNKTNSLRVRLCNTSDCTDGNDPIADSGAYEVTTGTMTLNTVPTDRGTMDASRINSYSTLYVILTASSSNPTNVIVADVQLQVPAAAGAGRTRRMF